MLGCEAGIYVCYTPERVKVSKVFTYALSAIL